MKWWQPVNVNIKQEMMPAVLPFTHVKADLCEPIDITSAFNASVTDIYRNEYLSPRSPYTTLQLPKQGIGEWCHPTLTADIDDSGMRALVRDGLLSTNLGVSFRTPEKEITSLSPPCGIIIRIVCRYLLRAELPVPIC